MLEFIKDLSTKNILDKMKEKYLQENGSEMEIGSEAFATSSVIAYILGVVSNRFNEMSKQRYLDTATGEYLLAIGETLGVKLPKGKHGTVIVSVTANQRTEIYDRQTIVQFGGVNFISMEHKVIPADEPTDVIFLGITPDMQDVMKENNVKKGDEGLLLTHSQTDERITNLVAAQKSGGAELPMMPGKDDGRIREYIRASSLWRTFGGSKEAYEQRAMWADNRVTSAYCIPYNGEGWTPGEASVYIQVKRDIQDNYEDVKRRVYEALTANDWKPVCDEVRIYNPSGREVTPRFIVYATKANIQAIKERADRTIKAYAEYLHDHLGADFRDSVLSKELLTPDENGVVAQSISSGIEYFHIKDYEYFDYVDYGSIQYEIV